MPLNFNPLNFQPNFGPNPSRDLPDFAFNIQNDARHGLDLPLVLNNSSNNFQNHVNYGQNELISQNNSQLSMSQRLITELVRRNSSPSQHRVQVQSFIDYFPVENQPGLSEVTVTEVVRTKFLAANSTRDRLLAPNDQVFLPSQEPSCSNRSLLTSNQSNQPSNDDSPYLLDAIFSQNHLQNQLNLPNTTQHVPNQMLDHPVTDQNQLSFHNISNQNPRQNEPRSSAPSISATMSCQENSPVTGSKLSENVCNQNPSQNQAEPNSMDLSDHPMDKSDDQTLDPEPTSALGSHDESIYDQNPSDDHEHYDTDNDQAIQKPISELLDEYYRNLVGDYSANPVEAVPKNQDRVPNVENSDDDEKTEIEDNNDGRTHSLSRKKYGPYTCPKCQKVFVTSQLFAAHVASSHYKYETTTERKRRLAAKYRKKNLHFIQSSDGQTLVPDPSLNKPRGRKKKEKTATKIEQDQLQNKEGAMVGDNKLVDVEVEAEYD